MNGKNNTLNIEMNDAFASTVQGFFLYKTFLSIMLRKKFLKRHFIMFRGDSILGFHCLGGVTRPVIHLKMVVEILCLGSHTALQVVKKHTWGKV